MHAAAKLQKRFEQVAKGLQQSALDKQPYSPFKTFWVL
jgi:hypothetical protein